MYHSTMYMYMNHTGIWAFDLPCWMMWTFRRKRVWCLLSAFVVLLSQQSWFWISQRLDCYDIAVITLLVCSEPRQLTWHNQGSTQKSSDPWEGWGLDTRVISSLLFSPPFSSLFSPSLSSLFSPFPPPLSYSAVYDLPDYPSCTASDHDCYWWVSVGIWLSVEDICS